jgi:hypothetical protein
MSKGKYNEAEMIGALKQLEAGPGSSPGPLFAPAGRCSLL